MKTGMFITHPTFSKEKPPHPWGSEDFQTIETPFESGEGILNLKKGFKLNVADVQKVTIRATALGIFDMYLNGKRIGENEEGYADELKPGWSDYRIRLYEYEYEITELCKEENLFVAEVSDGWWSGRISFDFYGTRPTAFIGEIEITYKDGKTEIIDTDETWETTIAGPVLRADIWDGEYYDSTIPKPSIYPDAHKWGKAVSYEYSGEVMPLVGPAVRVRPDLTRRPLSAVKHKGTIDNGTELGEIKVLEKKVGKDCESTVLKAGECLIMDMGQNMVGFPLLKIKAKKGTKVCTHIAEMLNDSGDPNRGNDGPKGSIYVKNYRSALARVVYIASGDGVETYHPKHSFYGFRYIELRCDADIEIVSVSGLVICSAFEETGTFVCDNPEINKLCSNVVWGMRGNYVSIPTDCPQRNERLGWTGDTQIFCGAASYLGNIQPFMHKWLYDLSDSQIDADGAYGDFAPRIMPWFGNAAWGDAGLVVPHRIWLMYNDKEILARQYKSMEWYMEFLSKNGLEGPGIAYGDWLNYDVTDKRYIAVSYYAYDAYLMAKFSQILGKTDRAEHYEKLRGDIVNHWTEQYIENGELKFQTQASYLIALAFDLVEGELKEKFIKCLENKIIENNYTLSTGFVGTGILNQTLEKVGLSNLAYSLLLQTADPSWLYSVRQGATTIWERWNSYTIKNGFGDVGMNSFNHYAYGAVAEWLYSGVCGIVPDESNPGFKHFYLKPSPDMRTDAELPEGQKKIEMAKATYNSVSGKIESSWEKVNGAYSYNFVIPEGTVATVQLLAGESIKVNDVSYTIEELGGKYCKSCGRVVFDLAEGKYNVVIK